MKRGKAKDSKHLLVAGFIAALIAWYIERRHEAAPPAEYDLTKYKPKPRRW